MIDLYLHASISCVVSYILLEINNNIAKTIIMILVIAIIKEHYDVYMGNYFDIWDFLATLAGVPFGYLVYKLKF